MCYACRPDQPETERTGRRTVIVARTMGEAESFMRERGMSLYDRSVVVLTPGHNVSASLRGMHGFDVFRVDGTRLPDEAEWTLETRRRTAPGSLRDVPGEASQRFAALMGMATAIRVRNQAGSWARDDEHRLEVAGRRERDRRAAGRSFDDETDAPSEVNWHSPHHWASTFRRSPWWNHETKKLHVPVLGGGDLVYSPEELDEDIRYV